MVQRRKLQTGVAAHVQAMKQTLQRSLEKAQRIVRTTPRIRRDMEQSVLKLEPSLLCAALAASTRSRPVMPRAR